MNNGLYAILIWVLVLVIAAVTAGCVSTKWVKPGASQEQMDREWKECAFEVEKAFAGANSRAIQGFGLQYEKVSLFKQCIELKGFREEVVK